jgi:hypothetical protein
MRGRGPTGLWPFALPRPNALSPLVPTPTHLALNTRRYYGPVGVGRSFHKWSGGRPKTGHLADASTLEKT